MLFLRNLHRKSEVILEFICEGLVSVDIYAAVAEPLSNLTT